MATLKELAFLLELRSLSSALLDHAAEIRRVAAEWLEAHEELRRPAAPAKPDCSLAEPDAYFASMVHAQNQRTAVLQELLDRSVDAQARFFVRVDALLALQGRISAILYPNSDKHPARAIRGQRLRSLLEIEDDHPISERRLRNKWIHFDEVLDAVDEGVSLQRFTRSTEVNEAMRVNTMRLFIVDTLTVVYQGFGEFPLDELFEAVADVHARTLTAIEDWHES